MVRCGALSLCSGCGSSHELHASRLACFLLDQPQKRAINHRSMCSVNHTENVKLNSHTRRTRTRSQRRVYLDDAAHNFITKSANTISPLLYPRSGAHVIYLEGYDETKKNLTNTLTVCAVCVARRYHDNARARLPFWHSHAAHYFLSVQVQ